jgi:AefR-like transcriptional repressor, C-terminal domain
MKRGVLRSTDSKTAAVHLLRLLDSELLQRVLLGVIESVNPEAVKGPVRCAVEVFLSGVSAPLVGAGPTPSPGPLPITLAVAVLTVPVACATSRLNLRGRFFYPVAQIDFGRLGYVIVGLFLLAWVCSVALWKLGRIDGNGVMRHNHTHAHDGGIEHSHEHLH